MKVAQRSNINDPSERDEVDFVAARRAFMKSIGLGTLGVATALGATSAFVDTADAARTNRLTDVKILNFALNLEYLEAEFYLRAAFGDGLERGEVRGRGRLGPVIGGRQVSFATQEVRLFAEEIARDEQSHVQFLRAVLGSRTVARPKIDLASSFTAAARAAGLVGPNEEFDAFANENNFLLAAFIFEDVGVTAYKGAARFIKNKDVLEAAAGILAVEAYHAGTIRTLLFNRGFFEPAQAISDLRDAVDGPEDLDQGIGDADTANITPADNQFAIAFSRTPRQVLDIVYLGGRPNDFGFFPNRLNGPIR